MDSRIPDVARAYWAGQSSTELAASPTTNP